jgi:hypothetical protein
MHWRQEAKQTSLFRVLSFGCPVVNSQTIRETTQTDEGVPANQTLFSELLLEHRIVASLRIKETTGLGECFSSKQTTL